MTKSGYARLTFALSIVSATLALSAALIHYLKFDELKVSLIAAGVFLLAFGFGAWTRNKSQTQ